MPTDDFRALADETAALLGTHWRTQSEDHHAPGAVRLICQDGPPIILRPTGDRITAWAPLPEGSHRVNGPTSPAITISAARGAAHIAGHLRRRLLPQYWTALAAFQERQAAAETEEKDRRRIAEDLALALAGAPGTGPDNRRITVAPSPQPRTTTVTRTEPGAPRVDAHVSAHGDDVDLKLTGLHPGQAVALCAVFRRMNP